MNFLYSSSVYSCHIFLISSASVRSLPFLFFIEHVFAWNVPLVSLIFLKRSLVFPILLFASISLHWSLRKAFLSLLAIFGTLHSGAYIFPFLLCFLLLFFSQLFVRPPQTAIVLFCISFPWGWSWSLSPVQCHKPHSIVHQALYLSDLGPRVYTWTSPDGQHQNQIDYILCSQRWRSLYSQQKQDQELTVALIKNSLLPNSDLNWRK